MAAPTTGRKIDRTRERATFQPIPPDLDIQQLIRENRNFSEVTRVDALTIDELPAGALRRLVQQCVIEKGLPLIIENWHLRADWPKWIFNKPWLENNHSTDVISVRDISKGTDTNMSLGHYLRNMRKLASRFTPQNFASTQQRLYAKDLDCPPVWRSALSQILPPSVFYLSESADLMSSLPEYARAENMMCYIGHEGTYTPAHKEMCASLGQNIMVDASPEASSIWFMTASSDRELVAEYWLSHMGHDIEVESHFASIDDLRQAPFEVFVVEQKIGDFILVPPLAPHQVWNRGETTMKAAWNRTTVDTLELAIAESLPKAKLVCRDEQYKNKAIIYETLRKYAKILKEDDDVQSHLEVVQVKQDFNRLFKLFNEILLDECFSSELPAEKNVERIENDYTVTCSFCRGNIFNRFLSCKGCAPPSEYDEEPDYYDICMECYSRGRSCGCISGLTWVEQHNWEGLLKDHEEFRLLVLESQVAITADSPKRFQEALSSLDRKVLARVCQEQLKVRPWQDITKELEDDDTHTIEEMKKNGMLLNCHVCKVRHPSWKSACCSKCNKAYCYGNLWRAFDQDPFVDILSNPNWTCPVCLGICSCGACRKNPAMKPYEPRGTMLGASTKHVADPRSVESLVDFARGNLGWLSKDLSGEKRKMESFCAQKEPKRHKLVFESDGTQRNYESEIPIDPALGDASYGQSLNPMNDSSSPEGAGMLTSTSISEARENGSNTTQQASPINKISYEPLLPSPSAMLTGALPAGREPFNQYSYPSDINQYNPGQHYSFNTHQNRGPTFVNHFYPHSSSTIQPTTVADATRLFEEQTQTTIDDVQMSSLEKDPLAFLAAAGLLQLPHSMPTNSANTFSAPNTSIAPFAPPITPSTFTSPAYDSQSEHSQTIHPSLTIRSTFTPTSAYSMPTLTPASQSLAPSPILSGAKKRGRPPTSTGRVASDLPPLPAQQEPPLASWVKKQKAAQKWAANLAKGRNSGRRKKELIVVLKISSESWKKWDEEKLEMDLVGSDLIFGGKRGDIIRIESVESSVEPIPVKRGRGRPRKSGLKKSDSRKWFEISDEENDERENEVSEDETIHKKPNRRESAWIQRKHEEEEAYRLFLESQKDESSSGHGRMPKELTAKPKRFRVRKSETLKLFDGKSLVRAATEADSDMDAEGEDDDMYVPGPAVSPPPILQEETEEEKVSREARAREEQAIYEARLAKEQAVLEKAQEAELIRIKEEAAQRQLEVERQKEKEWFEAIEKERKREEAIAKANREAKLLAAGIDIPSSESESEHGEDDEDVVMSGEQNKWKDLVSLIPQGSDFAVVIQCWERPLLDEYEIFEDHVDTDSESVSIFFPTYDSDNNNQAPSPSSPFLQPPITISSEETPVPTKRPRRGRPPKNSSANRRKSAPSGVSKSSAGGQSHRRRRKTIPDAIIGDSDDEYGVNWPRSSSPPVKIRGKRKSTPSTRRRETEAEARELRQRSGTARYSENADLDPEGGDVDEGIEGIVRIGMFRAGNGKWVDEDGIEIEEEGEKKDQEEEEPEKDVSEGYSARWRRPGRR